MAGRIPKPSQFFISHKGLSHAILVILITIIAISLMAIIFNLGNSFLQSQSRNPRITILDVSIIKLGSSVIVRYSIGNTGSEQLTSISIGVEGAPCSQPISGNLQPGQKLSSSFLCDANLPIGNKYVVRVQARASDGGTVGDAVWVRVEV